jgi:CRISPR type III-B/RAMP module-associated protein Cmr5
MSVLQNRKRERQVYAYNKVHEVNRNDFKKYKSLIEETGMMLYTNGLISTLAYLKAGEGEKKTWYKHLSGWFARQSVIPFSYNNHSDDLLEKVLQLDDARTLMLLTKEAIILSDAFKEMVKAKNSGNDD